MCNTSNDSANKRVLSNCLCNCVLPKGLQSHVAFEMYSTMWRIWRSSVRQPTFLVLSEVYCQKLSYIISCIQWIIFNHVCYRRNNSSDEISSFTYTEMSMLHIFFNKYWCVVLCASQAIRHPTQPLKRSYSQVLNACPVEKAAFQPTYDGVRTSACR